MSQSKDKARFVIDDNASALGLFGRHDENLRLIEKELGVNIVARGNELVLSGDEQQLQQGTAVLNDLMELAKQRPFVTPQEVGYAVQLVRDGEQTQVKDLRSHIIQVMARGKSIAPRTLGQKRYIEAMENHDVVFGIGPAGTGKTYLAMAMAVAALQRKAVNRLVLTRPAVEAGEKLGFLPGDLQDKVDPYLRPLYDALDDILGAETYQRYSEKGIIEVAPLAYMRGRTLDDAFVILDEAQNTTTEQMKMFLTRMGFGSKVVVTGDITQVDLPEGKCSGLRHIQRVLQGVDGIAFVYLSDRDVVRHELVQRIIKAYERYDNNSSTNGSPVT